MPTALGSVKPDKPDSTHWTQKNEGNCQPERSDLQRELELELIQTQMTQKPMLRAEVYARALRASQNRKEDTTRFVSAL